MYYASSKMFMENVNFKCINFAKFFKPKNHKMVTKYRMISISIIKGM